MYQKLELSANEKRSNKAKLQLSLYRLSLKHYDVVAFLVVLSTFFFKSYISMQGYPVGVGYDVDAPIYLGAFFAGKWEPNQAYLKIIKF